MPRKGCHRSLERITTNKKQQTRNKKQEIRNKEQGKKENKNIAL